MITYGHEQYIEESINGVLSQIFNAEVELIISNDNSPDNTEIIIQNLINTHPNGHWIKYIKHDENKGAIPNFTWSISQAKGKYIAICEGDDYWTDPLKLQKQVDFLELNPKYSLSFHKIKGISSNDTEPIIFNNPDEEKDYSINDLSKGNFIHTPSVVFRKNIQELPQWINHSPIGDYPLHMINASFGLIKYFPDCMATYRVGSGIWSTKSKVYQMVNVLFCLKLLIEHFKKNQQVNTNLKTQYDEYYTALSKPIEDKEKLSLQLKDYHYIEKIIDFNNLLKIVILKIAKKIGLKK